jgi:cytidine deaminase
MHLMKNLCEFCKCKKRRLGQLVFCRKEQRFVKPRAHCRDFAEDFDKARDERDNSMIDIRSRCSISITDYS